MTELGESLVVQTEKALPLFVVAQDIQVTEKEKLNPDDEYNTQNTKFLSIQVENLPKDIRGDSLSMLKKTYEYLSTTRGLEYASQRTKIIEEKIKEFYHAGATKFLVKPFGKSDLTKIINETINS